jgi:hypothetical protein
MKGVLGPQECSGQVTMTFRPLYDLPLVLMLLPNLVEKINVKQENRTNILSSAKQKFQTKSVSRSLKMFTAVR